MHEHGCVEVALGEHLRDVREVGLDLVATLLVACLVRIDLDDAAGFPKQEILISGRGALGSKLTWAG